VHDYLFSKVPVNADNIYRMPTEFTNPSDAAKDYEKTLKNVFQLKGKAFPPFDLVYLGLGDNAHTASLMPFTDEVKNCISGSEDQCLVLSTFVADLNMFRITLTPSAINNGHEVIFLVTGENKAPAVWEVLEGPHDPLHYPAQLIQNTHKKTIWYLDQAAASQLKNV
jgi:6-phosphogluconolactonase